MQNHLNKLNIVKILLISLPFVVLFCSCDIGGTPDGHTGDFITITENITEPTTWEAGKVYLIKANDFHVNATLTIEPGVVIKFHPTAGPYLVLGSGGTVVAVGTSAEPIVFTSYKDDDHGGDTNGDGTATAPAAGDWSYVSTNGQNDSIFIHCHFYYGGGGTDDSTLEIYNSIATVQNCKFENNKGRNKGVLDASTAKSGTVITGNTFKNNQLPLYINTTFDIDDSNSFANNTYNGIFLNNSFNFLSNVKWEETEVAFVITNNDLWIKSGVTLTLGNNVVLKFMPDTMLTLENGPSALGNHDGPGVAFTSYKDDTRKGDTNGDGSATTPANGDWQGIYDNRPGESWLNWGNIYYDSH